LWDRYPSLGTIITSDKRGALAVKSHQHPGPFIDNLFMQPAVSLDELWNKVAKYMQLEELREFRNQARAEASGEKSKGEKDRQGRSGQRGDRREDNRD